jgi:aspartate/methionine/tyrosine aminotransferase
MKMPDPMIPPITTMVASKGPSARRKVTRALYREGRGESARAWATMQMMSSRFHAPYMEWAKTRPAARYDLAGSNVLACTLDDLEGAKDALSLSGRNDNGYAPLVEAIARHAGVDPACVTTGTGAAGANFQVCAALLEPGDDVVMERPGYDPLLGAARLLGARPRRFDRVFEEGYALDPDRLRAAITPATRLIILTSPHNPTSALLDAAALLEVGRIAEQSDAYVLMDEVYLDAASPGARPAATVSERFVSTSSLTKSYGLSSLRCGWAIAAPPLAERIRRARDVIDGNGAIPAERLATLALEQADRLLARATALLTANRQRLRAFLDGSPELEYVDSGRGTVVFPRIAGVDDSTTFVDRLFAERDTAVAPGHFFEAPAHFRIGIGGPADTLDRGLTALRAALDARAWRS